MSSRWVRYANGLLPGLVVASVSIAIAWGLGGPIAAAIVGFVGISAMLIDAVFCLSLLHASLSGSRAKAVAIGAALYVLSVIVIFAGLHVWGPSQVM